jgi:hypothetical protein
LFVESPAVTVTRHPELGVGGGHNWLELNPLVKFRFWAWAGKPERTKAITVIAITEKSLGAFD